MVVTLLEARIEPEQLEELEEAFRERAVPLPPAIYEMFLLTDSADASLVRIVTVWTSRSALDAMRAEAEPGRGPFSWCRERGSNPHALAGGRF